MDRSGANLVALEALNTGRPTPIKVRQNKYLNNLVKQDHRAIKRTIKPIIGFKDSFVDTVTFVPPESMTSPSSDVYTVRGGRLLLFSLDVNRSLHLKRLLASSSLTRHNPYGSLRPVAKTFEVKIFKNQ